MNRMSADIEVGADPATAFAVFTEEYDQWWGNGPTKRNHANSQNAI